jgi:DNA topoisomerase-2
MQTSVSANVSANVSAAYTVSVTNSDNITKSKKNKKMNDKKNSEEEQELSHKYQKKTDKEHVLHNPDTYTGSMEMTEYDTYIFNEESKTIMAKQITIIPGLYKLFDEGVVNCRDHCVRMTQNIKNGDTNAIPVSTIDISISDDGSTITMFNDGNGIDVAKHPEEDIWIPEMIFGHLRTSTNYDTTQKKITGGKNGFGFKLVLIWSTWGKIETLDHVRGLKYTQEFSDNLNVIKPPIIEKCAKGKKPYTKVSFKPDFKRLKIPGLSAEMIALFKRRVYDIAAITDKNIKVKYNGDLVPVKHFQHYVDLYIGAKADTTRIYEEANERWEYVVCLAPKEEFTQVSFVNGIYTGKGGKHVDYLLNQIVRKLSAYIKQKKKIDVKPTTIKEQLMLFVRCDIDNPTFESQTKDYMNTPVANFGSSCEISDKFIEKIAKMGVMDAACALTEVKENKEVKKKDGAKTKSVRGIPKYVGANYAGTERSGECTLILCEGDSAKAGIISGLSTTDRNTIGVYPMRGKLLNVRGESSKRITDNKEIHEMIQIIGLETGKKYTKETAQKSLRYGKVIFMTDQDRDGSHIKGLGINLIDSEWETLLDIPGFIGFMNTPIIKARKGTQEILFYNDGEYKEWKENAATNTNNWKIKFYKGLGTSTGKEFKEYFANKKMVDFISNGQESRDAIDMVFNKKRAQDRKEWLYAYDRNAYLDTNKPDVTYQEFIKKEMSHFSKYDCERSIPNGVDGLKTSLRKVLFTCFKRKITDEIKVAQLSGSVSELSCYHHGEQSLNGTIVGMAQDFVGANNIHLLEPRGQFGTRLQGGSDSASERYIFTCLSKLTRYIFPEADDCILDYLNDDGTSVEPIHYVPILPMIAVNGSKGIGTGFSTDIMCHDPLTIMDYLVASISGKSTEEIIIKPYYEGFKGEITPLSESKYLIKGKYEILNEKQVRITELPIGTWTDDYKQYIEELIEGEKQAAAAAKKSAASSSGTPTNQKKKKSATATSSSSSSSSANIIKDYVDMSTDVNVDITITFANGALKELREKDGGECVSGSGNSEESIGNCTRLEKLLKITTTKSNTNMHAFDEEEKLVKFATIKDLIDHFIKVRMAFYVKRKAHQLKELQKEALVLSNKARFISAILDDTLDLRRKKTAAVVELLKEHKYELVDGDIDYKYLVRMPLDSVTEENVDRIIKEKERKLMELQTLEKTSEVQIWLNELAVLRKEYLVYRTKKQESTQPTTTTTLTPKKIVKKKLVNLKLNA